MTRAVRSIPTAADQELFDAFTTYQEGRGLSACTLRRRRCCLGRFVGFMTPRSVTAAKGCDIDEWLARLSSAGTRKAYYSDLVAFFKWAHRRELIATNPMTLTDRPKNPKSLPKPARVETIAAAVAMSDGPVQLMILLGALAGLRVSEIAALSTDDIYVDNEPPVLVVRQGKGGKDRIVPIHPTLVDRLRHVRPGWLFPSERPGLEHMQPGSVGLAVCAALTAAGDGQHVTAHQLRHYFGTEASKWSNGNLVLVGGLMGHGSPATTAGYVAWNPTDGADVVSRIGGAGRLTVPDELAHRRRAAS